MENYIIELISVAGTFIAAYLGSLWALKNVKKEKYFEERKQIYYELASILPIIDTVGTGIRIMNLRKQSGLSVKELQNILGFATPNAIYKWQNGAAMPTLDNLIVLAAVFNVPIDDIIVTDNKLNISIGA